MKKISFSTRVFFLLMYCFVFLQQVNAADIIAQDYAAASSPGIKSCTAGYDLLSGDINYQQPLISSKIPLVLNYRAPLRSNLSAAQDFAQLESSTLGWSDNFQSTILIQNISSTSTQYQDFRYSTETITSPWNPPKTIYHLKSYDSVTTRFSAKVIYVRLPGELSFQLFKEQDGVFSRLYSADPIRDLNNTAIQNLPWSNDLGEYSLNRSGGQLNVIKNGVKFAITSNYNALAPSASYTNSVRVYLDTRDFKFYETTGFWGADSDRSNTVTSFENSVTSSIDLYRVASVEQNGRKLSLEYDGLMNLKKVTDPYKNTLTFERTFHESSSGATQTIDESRLITKILYANAGQSVSQTADLKYQSYEVTTPSTGIKTKTYALIETNSTIAGKTTFINSLTELGAVKAFVASKGRTADSSYYYPVLKQVKNALDQVVRQWDVTQNYVLANGAYSTAQTTLRSFAPNNSGTMYDNTSVYDDISKSITTTVALGGTTVGTNTIINSKDSNGNFSINSTGYPCMTIGDVPVSSASFNTTKSQLLQFFDRKNTPYNYSYDGKNRLASMTEASSFPQVGRTTFFQYGENGDYIFTIPTAVVKIEQGLKPTLHVINTVDANGNIIRQQVDYKQPGSISKVTTYSYFSDINNPNYGLLQSVDGPRSGTADKITYAYDTFGNLSSQSQTINGAVRTTSYLGYNTFGKPERIVNASGLVEQFIYNADGTIKEKNVGIGGTTGAISGKNSSYVYDALKRIVSEKSPDGEITTYQYNLAGLVSLITNGNGNKISFNYFPTGIKSSEVYTNSANAVFKQDYTVLDINGRVAKQYTGNNTNQLFTSYSYDNNGNLIQTNTAQGIVNKWTYDVLNRVVTHTDGMGNIDTKDYDTHDNIISEKDALNAGSQPLTYRNGNVLTQEVNSDFGTKTYSYNEADQLTQRIHALRKCNYNNIDESGRYRAFVCTANSGTAANEYQINDNYTYDQSRFGRLDKVTSSIAGLDVNTNYSYDAYDRITQKSQVNLLANRWLNTTNQSLNVNYSYSTEGKPTSITLPSGRVVGYSYNLTAGILTGINLNNSALIRGITYDGANRITGWSWGASGTASYGLVYANNGLLSSIVNKNNSAVNYSLSYGYDADGRIVSIARDNGMKDSFTYDAADRLTSENRLNGSTSVYSISYTYDKNGNRIGLSATGTHLQPAAIATYTYSGNKLATFSKGGVAQALTITGNSEVAFGSYTAAYDNGGRRKADHGTGHYYYMNYNHKNERNTRGYVANNAASNVIQYVYDEESHLIGEYSGATPIVEYVWLGDKPVAAIYGSGAATKIYYIITDHLNTPRRLVDSSNQAIVWSWDSTAFGVGAPVASVTFNLRFPGQYYDVGTGQFYNHNRFYNPELGRYMEPDPIGLEGGLNPFVYAGNNPVMNSDPSGLILHSLSDLHLSMMAGINNSLNNYILNQQINLLNYNASTMVSLSDSEMRNVSGGVAPLVYYIVVSGGFVLTVDGLVDGEPPQAKGAKVADKAVNFYRGAKAADIPHFNPRSGEIKIDGNGFVKNGSDFTSRGVSLFNNSNSLASKGFVPYKVDPNTLPKGLGIYQRGADPKHFEIIPTPGTFLTPEQYMNLCSKIKCVR